MSGEETKNPSGMFGPCAIADRTAERRRDLPNHLEELGNRPAGLISRLGAKCWG
jgi:hypothetical protein